MATGAFERKLNRREFLRLAGVGGATLLAAGCHEKSSPEKSGTSARGKAKPIKMEFLVPGMDANLIWRENFQPWVDRFNKEHPGVFLEMSTIPWVSDREITLTRLVSGEPPDIILTHSIRVVELGQALKGLVEFEQFDDFDEVSKRFVKARLDACKAHDGKHYGIPLLTIIFAMCCDMSVLRKLGVEPPKTWSEFREVAKACTIPGKRWGVGWPMGADIDTAFRMYPMALPAGGRFLSEDLKTAMWNDRPNLAAMELVLNMKKDGSFVPGTDAWTSVEEFVTFNQGMFAMARGGPWIPLVCSPERLKDLILIPTPRPDTHLGKYPAATLCDDIMVTISRQSKHQDLAWEFLKLFRSAEADRMWLNPAMGGIPVVKESLETPEWKKFWGRETYDQEAGVAIPWPYSPILPELHSVYALAVSQVWSGQKELRQAFDEGVKRCNRLLAKF